MQDLSELIEIYPSQYTRGIQTIITAKKEFNELASTSKEVLLGQFFKHQLLTHRVLRFLDDFLVISETGTGKSAEILGFTESALQAYQNERAGISYDDRLSHFDKVIIFAGKLQEEDIRNQLVCKLSNNKYITDDVINAKSEKTQKSAVKRAIKNEGITITQYRKFANKISRDYPETPEGDARLSEDFADTIFWIDEVHNLSSSDDGESDNVSDDPTIYNTFWRLFHVAKRCKRIISSATPMINSEEELKSILNLILPRNGEIPLDFDYTNLNEIEMRTWFPNVPVNADLSQYTREQLNPYFRGQIPEELKLSEITDVQLEPYLRGRIGYIRALDTGAVKVYKGDVLDLPMIDNVTGEEYLSKVITTNSYMSKHQMRGYFKVRDRNDVNITSRQAADIVFPDGYLNSNDNEPPRGFRKYVIKKGSQYYMTPELRRYFSSIEGIRELSCKYANIVEHVMNEPGNCFVYVNFVALGAITLGLCLEGMGFERYQEKESVFISDNTQETLKPYCVSQDNRKNRFLKHTFQTRSQGGKWKYALISGDTNPNERMSILEAMNSYENRHGDLIKVLITSMTGRDGINVSNVLQIHLVGSEWNQSAMYQAESRGVRATSHYDLLREEQQRLINTNQDPKSAKIDINIYLHAAIAEYKGEFDSVDLEMYCTAEMKDRRIKRIMRMLKRCSVGCQINYKRNVRDTDIDYTPACDYDVCKYSCFDPKPKEIDYSTYDIIYSEQITNNIKSDISRLFVKRSYISLDEMVNELSKYRDLQIIKTVEQLITEKIPILDKYGYISYLKEDGDIYYLDKSYDTIDNYKGVMNSYYSSNLIGIEKKETSEISEMLTKTEIGPIINHLLKLFSKKDINAFESYLVNLDVETQALILEDAISKYYSDQEFDKNTTIYLWTIFNKYKRWITSFNEPVNEIAEMRKEQIIGKKKRGKKAKGDKLKIKNYKDKELDEIIEEGEYNDKDGDPLVVHILYSQAVDRTKYAITSRFNKAEGRIRIYDISLNYWRDVTQFEAPIYNKLIQIANRIKIKPLEELGLYGMINIDGSFRIVNKLLEEDDAKDNGRKIRRGKDCLTYERDELIDVMWEIRAPLKNIELLEGRVLTNEERENAIEFLLVKGINKDEQELRLWSSEQLLYYIAWYHKRDSNKENTKEKTREYICNLIRKTMLLQDRII